MKPRQRRYKIDSVARYHADDHARISRGLRARCCCWFAQHLYISAAMRRAEFCWRLEAMRPAMDSLPPPICRGGTAAAADRRWLAAVGAAKRPGEAGRVGPGELPRAGHSECPTRRLEEAPSN